MVELKISVERDLAVLGRVMDAIIDAHHYEEPVISVREDWASRATYDLTNDNPNSWWNNRRGLPGKIDYPGLASTTSTRRLASRPASVVLGARGER